MRGIGMVDRNTHLARALHVVVFETLIDLGDSHEIVEPAAPPYRVSGKLQDPVVPGENVERRLVVADARNAAPARVILQLKQSHGTSPLDILLGAALFCRAATPQVQPASTMKFC